MKKLTIIIYITFLTSLFLINANILQAQDNNSNNGNDNFQTKAVTTASSDEIVLNILPYTIPVISRNKSNNDNLLTTKTWVGAGSGGSGTDFNAAANWSPSGTPGPLDDCVMNPTSAASVNLSANITINSLTVTFNTTASGSPAWNLRVQDFALTINGNLTANNTGSSSGTKQLVFRVGNTSNVTTGAIIVGGNANFGSTGASQVILSGVTNSRGRYEFQGDVTFGAQGETSPSLFPYRYVFSKSSGTQTLTVNNSNVDLSAVEIGNQTTSFPTLVLAGSSNAVLSAGADRNYLIVYSGSTLDLSTKTFNATSTSSGDTLYIDNSATIKAGGTSGGLTGSNLPSNFRGYRVYPNSTVMYNGTSGQTQSLTGFFYNLTIDNSAGVTLGGATSVNSVLYLSKGTYTNGTNLTIANGKTISRDIGSLSASPTFTTSVNVIYTGTTGVTTGRELPASNLSTVLNDLTINKSGGVTLDSNRTVNDTLEFISGNLNTGTRTLFLGNSSLVTGESTNAYLVGKLSITRTVGTGSSSFGNIGVDIDAGTDNIGNVTIQRTTGSAGIITFGANSGISRSWVITSGADPDISGRTLTLSWVSADDNSKDMTQAQGWRKISAGNYEQFSNIQDVSSGNPRNLTANLTTDLNNTTWTISDPVHPLPVELISFNALTGGRDVTLTWVTAFEINNKGFNIERRSFEKDKYTQWQTIDFVSGSGTTNEHKIYNYKDKNLSSTKYQYRLKQLDFNGNHEYFSLNSPSEIIIGKPIAFEVSQNYPNPSNPNSKIDFQIPVEGMVSLKIYNLLGQEVASLLNEQKEAGFYTANFDGSSMASGIYFYRLIVSGKNSSFEKTLKMILVK